MDTYKYAEKAIDIINWVDEAPEGANIGQYQRIGDLPKYDVLTLGIEWKLTVYEPGENDAHYTVIVSKKHFERLFSVITDKDITLVFKSVPIKMVEVDE